MVIFDSFEMFQTDQYTVNPRLAIWEKLV